jgi:hypothetical protein
VARWPNLIDALLRPDLADSEKHEEVDYDGNQERHEDRKGLNPPKSCWQQLRKQATSQ